MAPVCEAFAKLTWADSKLLALTVAPANDGLDHIVSLELQLLTERDSVWTHEHRTLSISGCRFLGANLDLLGKRLCSNDILGATCSFTSARRAALITSLVRAFNVYRAEEKEFADLIHFHLQLVPPGGELEVLGREFSLSELEPGTEASPRR